MRNFLRSLFTRAALAEFARYLIVYMIVQIIFDVITPGVEWWVSVLVGWGAARWTQIRYHKLGLDNRGESV